jgi:[protein-PII] uridylyltransferase
VEDLLVKDPPDQVVLRMSENLPLSYLHDTAPERLVAELKSLAGLAESKSFVTTLWDVDNSTLKITVGTRENVATGIFHRLTGALTSQRLEILSADIHTLKNGFVLDHFVVQDPDFSGQPSAERCETIREAIFNSLESKKPPTFPKQWKALTPPNLTQNRLPPRVKIDEESSDHSTIVEVFAHDSLGLLYRIALAIYEAGLSVRAAKIGTYLDQVVDAFHVTDTLNSKVIDPVKLNQLRQSLERIIAEDSLEDA